MKILKVTLKQHTPLIHFQHSEEGATLRASEVKPKLDKYIIEKIGKGSYDDIKNDVRRNYKYWFVNPKDTYALDYKLTIEAIGANSTTKIPEKNPPKIKTNKETKKKEMYFLNDFPLLLSNLGGKTDKSKLVNFSYHDTILLTFIIPDSKSNNSFSSQIINYIAPFFANYNFGQRSSKGFGSFSVISITDNNGSEIKLEWDSQWLPSGTPLLQYEIGNKNKYELFSELFSVIDFYWKYLKSGINYTKRIKGKNECVIRKYPQNYHKSYLFDYLQEKGYTWEKRIIKTKLNLISVRAQNDPIIKEDNKPYFFARAHLGCPIKGITYKIKKGKFQHTDRGGDIEEYENFDISIINNIIERIPSSISFKPIFSTKNRFEEKNVIKQSNAIKIVTIYILYNNQITDALRRCPNTDFTFQKGQKTVSVPLFINNDKGEKIIINLKDLITNYLRIIKTKEILPINFRGENIIGNRKITTSNT